MKDEPSTYSTQAGRQDDRSDRSKALCGQGAGERDAASTGGTRLEISVQQLRLVIAHFQVELASMRSSWSCRITKPLRGAAKIFRREMKLGEALMLIETELWNAIRRI